ncbi:hypothetical protein, partial [Commensalibacter intestini]|uniref:hypothetical protein n=1 Tax=Commensalibacter intestini TaxID=479936 RepID=UPI000A36A0ED
MKLHNVVSVASILGAILSFNLQQEAKANVADDLNKNYNNIVNNCGSDTSPAYECSGNLVRLTSASTQYHVWDPSPNSINVAKGISFTYLRHDIKVDLRFAGHLSGIIYYPNMQKPSSTDASEVRCAFPTDGFTINGRENGCGATGWSAGSGPCQDQGIYTADAWYTHFMSVTQNSNNQYQHQCSFTMSAGTPNTATIFDEDLKAIRKVFHYENDGLNHASYNELLMKLWPLNAKNIIDNPEKLPIQAFFYMNKDGKSGLADAQYYQQDYYKTAKIIIPIVELNNDDTANISFSYHPQDRGVTIADELNVNYNNIVDNCGSKKKPAYECSGILFRQASYSSSSHVWDPNAKSIQYGGISFSYLRKDIHFKNFLHSNRSSGFIYYPSQQVQSGADSTEVSCAFPVGGKTDYRSYGRCGGSFSYPQASTECQQQNINTAEEWYTHFM